jgi:hypothetical protein
MVGIQYRDVFCLRDSDNEAVDISLCDNRTRPTVALSVCNTQPCQNFNWMADSNWGPCTMQANGFYQRTRTFHCHASDGSTALRDSCVAGAGKLPIAVLPCTPGTCASADGCPIVEIADTFNQCTLAQIQACTFSTACGTAGRVLDNMMEVLGFRTRIPASLKCVADYVAGLPAAEKPTTGMLNYVNAQLTAGTALCGATMSGAHFLSPVNTFSVVLVSLFAFLHV